MREVICVSVILIGLAGREQPVVPTYVPTIATAAATIAETSPDRVELAGSSVAVVRRSMPEPVRRRRLFRGRRACKLR